ncbi:MAG: hypothetical protein LUD16_01265 [Lachnospiraceae bacterium]|nr:hypothetical protein [Lachnospiraceae bacterium]MCD8398446.1 hypothetical protein [Lachnospiraceae bacterium]
MNRLIYRALSGRFGAYLELQILMRQTAKAFGAEVPKAAGRSTPELLKVYAQFTAKEGMRAIQHGDNLETLHQKLYEMAYALGNQICRWLKPKDEKECFAVITLLYHNIRIQMEGEAPGTVCVRKCYFSDFYTPEICDLISAIDQGIFAGIYQNGKLTFRERITEGYDVCRADFR